MNEVCVALDLETTGTDPRRDRIIEVGAIKFLGSQVLERLNTFVDPGCEVPDEITALTGIVTADLKGAPTPAEAVARLRPFIGAAPVVGQHLAFDLAFLEAQGLVLANPVFDTFTLSRILWPALSSHSLASLAHHAGVATTPAHRALADAQRSLEVLLALGESAQALRPLLRAVLARLLAQAQVPEAGFFLALESPQLAGVPATADGPAWPWQAGQGTAPTSPPPSPGLAHLSPEALARLLGPDGPLARAVPNFELRPQQEEMARAVAAALAGQEHLVVEAGTGTGKSLAYLLPAALLALAHGRRVVISTNTLNLQQQLIAKDIPALERALTEGGLVAEAALNARALKGRANYLCPQRLQALLGAVPSGADEARLWCRLLVWMADGASGDLADLPLNAREQALTSRLTAQIGNCTAQCPPRMRSGCPLQRSRQEAHGCHILVVNHALLLSDLLGEGQVLPDYDYLVIDEAHHLEAQATEQLSFQVGSRELAQALDALSPGTLPDLRHHLHSAAPAELQRLLPDLAADLSLKVETLRVLGREFLSLLASFLDAHAERQGDYDRTLRLTSGIRAQPAWAAIEQAWAAIYLHYQALESGLSSLLGLLKSEDEDHFLDYEGLTARLAASVLHLAEQREHLDGAVANPQPGTVYWGVLSPQGNAALAAAPLEVGPVLKARLFDDKCVVLTSATLSTESNFEYLKARLGLDGPRELLLDSPFDYRSAALVCIPRDIPEPAAPAHPRAVEQALAAIAEAAQGRTLALFTSHAALRAARDALTPRLRQLGIALLAQGIDGTPAQLLARFKQGRPSLLLGTSSFWEGVDVVGEALSVVVVVKLPFAVPSDPIFAARSELFDDPFNQYALPQAVLRFKQGFGRLIRSRTDRGVLVALDRRLLSKSYGQAFLRSLPGCTVERPASADLGGVVHTWLEGHR